MLQVLENKDWQLASAKVELNESTRQSLAGLNSAATRDFQQYGPFHTWQAQERVDNRALDLHNVFYTRTLFHGVEAIKEAFSQYSPKRESQLLNGLFLSENTGTRFGFGLESFTASSGGGLLFNAFVSDAEEHPGELLRALFACFNFVPSFAVQEFGDRTCLGPLEATNLDFGFAGPFGVKNERQTHIKFIDGEFQNPREYQIVFDDAVSPEQVQVALIQAFELLRVTNTKVSLVDEPGLGLPPEGVWSIQGSGSYRPGFDPWQPPPWLQDRVNCVRYPLLQKANEAGELVWQIDIIHTEDDSFLDIQTSQGRESLESFLKTNELAAEFWDGAFGTRWNLPVNPVVV